MHSKKIFPNSVSSRNETTITTKQNQNFKIENSYSPYLIEKKKHKLFLSLLNLDVIHVGKSGVLRRKQIIWRLTHLFFPFIFFNFLCSCIVKDLGSLSPVEIKIGIDFLSTPNRCSKWTFTKYRVSFFFFLRSIARKLVSIVL